MAKIPWKYKRLVNKFFYLFREKPIALKGLKNFLYHIRNLLRLGKMPQADLTGEKVLSKNKGYLYVAIPKVATRSILSYFEKYDERDALVLHSSLNNIISENDDIVSAYWFSFVRNPWARAYSCWLDKISNQLKFCDITIISRYEGLKPDMPFDKFVEWLCSEEGSDEHADRHWMSQYELLGGEKYVEEFNFIGKIENLSDDFSIVGSKINVGPNKLPELNLNQKDPLSYRDKYNDATKALIAKRYKKDVTYFKYNF
ncbi:hypothetical protein FX988_01631 [Paraglaciecola mesophila]|uniref:Sulfotransferase family protein n=1 Tax=Paraglaciecola mesophila TaxID=197222 RepID=A0A857JJD1_9ALTE|nr:sulfotransferase family 2 domain-containing protein [Paraglaciecola mesophila]QHJ11402.1 hypothetical protein FX988_01631 [Paraglaciecola mesophila]